MRYFIGFLVTMGLIILLIVLIFRGGGNNSKVPDTSKALTSYADTDSEVSMDVSGPITAESTHQQYRIAVDRNNVVYETITGYQNNVTSRRTFENNRDAYYAFLRALERAGFTQGDNSKDLANETSLCPLGTRYVFKLEQDGNQLQRYWITSCDGVKTYLGNFPVTNSLFQLQVPNFSTLNSGFTSNLQ